MVELGAKETVLRKPVYLELGLNRCTDIENFTFVITAHLIPGSCIHGVHC